MAGKVVLVTATDDDRGGPSTSGGKALRGLLDERYGTVLRHLGDPGGLSEVTRQTFGVAVRRRFAGPVDLRDVTIYVAGALARQRLRTGGRLAREAEALIRTSLGEVDLLADVPALHVAELRLAILLDLTGPMTAEQRDALVVAAEARARRYAVDPPARGRRRFGRRGGR
jgi:hypothetical protein